MTSAFIDDGYTSEEIIDESDRHPRVAITFRPMLPAERTRLLMRGTAAHQQGVGAATELERRQADAAAVAASNAVAASLAKHLKSWDLTRVVVNKETHEEETVPAPITQEMIMKLTPALFEKIYTAVAKFGDHPLEPPAAGETNENGDVTLLESQAEASAKNS